MVNSWKMEEFTAIQIQKYQEEGKMLVPTYQRGLVWKKEQKNDLIDSIKKGLPFGSILLYKDEENGTYRIIDGLQRCSTIYEFIQNPSKYFNTDDVDETVIEKIYKMTQLQTNKLIVKDKIINIIIDWIKADYKTMEEISGMQYRDGADKIADEFPTLKGKEKEIAEILKPMLQNFISTCTNMATTKIPAIVILGDEDALPIIFERINSRGSQLTKWQIYAATWSDDKIIINDELKRIINYNMERYDTMNIEDNIQFDDENTTSELTTNGVNTFQLIFGFGKMISNEFPQLFTTKNKATHIESIGFNLVNACLAHKNNEIKHLNINLRKELKDDETINLFLEKIIECIRFVDNTIAMTTKFKSNVRNNSAPVHTEMQICSLIASVFINKYMKIIINDEDQIIKREINLKEPKENWKTYKNKFKQNAIKIYLMDILQSSWRGSGDKKLNNTILNNDYYIKNVTETELSQVLNIWYENMKTERKEYQKVMSPKEPERAILNIIYSNVFTAADQIDGTYYDIEHLATKELMKNQLARFNTSEESTRLPISALGNLCFLREEINRKKKGKTIYQIDVENLQEIEDKFTFTKREDLKWIEDFSTSKEEFIKSYNNFIDNRYIILKDKLLEILYDKK